MIKLSKHEENKLTKNTIKEFIGEDLDTKKARSKNKINKAFCYANDDEWYTTKEDVQFFIDQAKISKKMVIWCPFDLQTSNFVTVFKKNGYKVISSHILTGGNFYKYKPKHHWDVIVSNPPFKNKHNLLKRLLEFGPKKKWALIFGIQCLNSEKFCDMLQQFYKPQYIHLKRRMCFTKNHLKYDVKHLQRPSFASMWVCNNLFTKDIQVWKGVDYKKDGKVYC